MSETSTSAALLRRGLIITKDTMPVPGKKKVLDLPSVGYEASFSTADIRELSDAHFSVFATEFAKQFNPQFAYLRRTWFANLRAVVREVETRLGPIGKYSDGVAEAVREMHPLVDQANVDLRRRCASYSDALEQLAQTCYQDALRAAWRAAKRQSASSKVKVAAEFELTKPVPPAIPIVPETRYVVMPTGGRR